MTNLTDYENNILREYANIPPVELLNSWTTVVDAMRNLTDIGYLRLADDGVKFELTETGREYLGSLYQKEVAHLQRIFG